MTAEPESKPKPWWRKDAGWYTLPALVVAMLWLTSDGELANFGRGLIGLVALSLPAWLPALFFKIYQRSKVLFAVLLATYLISYGLMSMKGEYMISNHGGNDWSKDWAPKYLVVKSGRPRTGRASTDYTLLGSLYWPCIFLDSWLWHKAQDPGI